MQFDLSLNVRDQPVNTVNEHPAEFATLFKISDMKVANADSQKVWLCTPSDGHSMDKGAMESLAREMHEYMQTLADRISKDNGGAEIQVDGALQSIYKSSFCSGADIWPVPATAGTGPIKPPVKLPTDQEVEAKILALTKTYESYLSGDWGQRTQMNLSGLIVVGSGADAAEGLKTYTAKRVWNK